MKLQRLRNNDLVITIPSRQQNRWRELTATALEVTESAPFQTYRDKRISEDLRELRRELGCRNNTS